MTHHLINSPTVPITRRLAIQLTAVLSCAALGSVLVGCASAGGSSSGGFASVIIKNHTPEEIASTTVKVFKSNGYTVARYASGDMQFEKEASRSLSLTYQSFVDMQEGTPALIRVRANVVSLGAGSNRLECQAYVVTGGGDAYFQETSTLPNIRSGPYQALLEQVAAELK